MLPALVLGCGMLRGLQVLRATVRGDESTEIRELLCCQRDELIAGLTCLQGTGRPLAGGDKRGHLRAVGIEVANDRGLCPHGVLKARHRVLPTRLSICDQRLVGEAG